MSARQARQATGGADGTRAVRQTVGGATGAGAEADARLHWMPRQHGAWAMLAVPLVLGVIASRPSPWQLVLLATAVAGYLASGAGLDWLRARRTPYMRRAATFAVPFAVGALALLVSFPRLLAAIVVLGPAALVVAWVTARGSPRSLLASLAQVAQSIVLVPAAAGVGGPAAPGTVTRAALVAGLYLVSSVLVVRSMIRERGNERFLGASIGYHAAAVVVQAWLLPWPYVALGLGMLARAAGLPLLQVRLTGSGRRLRPIHLGLVEAACSVALVLVALLVRF